MDRRPITENTLFYGDNLKILREYITSECIDLIYLDPPFNSSRNYNVLFKDESGIDSEAQIVAFEDTWHWNHTTEETYRDLTTEAPDNVSQMIAALRGFVGTNQMMAYLVMMAARLVELHRVLKPTGSLYLHCDPTASHYLRIILDTIFGPENFKNEIIWKRSDAHNDAKKQFGAISDHLLFYSRSKEAIFNRQFGGFQERTLRDWYQYLEFPDGTVRRMTKEERDTQIIPQGARRFNTDNLRSPNPRPNLTYDYKGYKPHPNGWAVSYERMCELDAKGLLLFPSSPEGRIMRKKYLDETGGAVLGDIWTDISQIRGADAELLGYPTQKPLSLLERIIGTLLTPQA
jgi:site-specific DNA-methyltransferase (adenine-specific)